MRTPAIIGKPEATAALPSSTSAVAPALLQLLASLGSGAQGSSSALPPAPTVDVCAVVEQTAREVVGSVVGADTPLMEAGLDSLGAVELRSRLASRLDDADLPETLVFDFPTLRQLEAHLITQCQRPEVSSSGAAVESAAVLKMLHTLGASVAQHEASRPTTAQRGFSGDPDAESCVTCNEQKCSPAFHSSTGFEVQCKYDKDCNI